MIIPPKICFNDEGLTAVSMVVPISPNGYFLSIDPKTILNILIIHHRIFKTGNEMILVVDVVNNVVVLGVAEHINPMDSLFLNHCLSNSPSSQRLHRSPRVWIRNSQGFSVGPSQGYPLL